MALIKLAARGETLLRNAIKTITPNTKGGVDAASRFLRYVPKLEGSVNQNVNQTLSKLKNTVQDYRKHVGITEKGAFSNITKAVADNPKLTQNAMNLH